MAISGHKTISIFLRYNIVAPHQLHSAMQAVELQQAQTLEGDTAMQRKPAFQNFDATTMQRRALKARATDLSD
jgi:hypothetical protein